MMLPCLRVLVKCSASPSVETGGDPVETRKVAALPGGPLGSLRWLVSSLAPTKERLKSGHITRTGSPGGLIPVIVRAYSENEQLDERDPA